MSIEVNATYENGMLKLDRPLPLAEHERVKVVIEPQTSVSRRSYGIIGWTGDADAMRKIALDPEFGIEEAP